MSEEADPFGTAGLRRRVLDAWAASPARFREDANAEEDLARGSYRDRVVVELAQNAADAASRGGMPGRLVLRLAGTGLEASNTGAPLDAAGVESLSTLRASAKRDVRAMSTGRFGVGFAAVLAVSDEPCIASSTGAVRWSAAQARDAVAAVPALAAELARRGGAVPVLRLPRPARDRPVEGWTTTVRLPLRDSAATSLARRLLDDVDDALLLALPALDEIVVEVDGRVRSVTDAGRWHVVRRSGALAEHLLRDRPVEERDRPWWSVAWARPLAGQPVPSTVHAPTPTDEPLELPALLVASFPLDPGRRHVAPGPLTDFLVGQAATAYADLAIEATEADDPLELVPSPVAAGALDAALRAAVLAALSAAPVLRPVGADRVPAGRVHPAERVHPADALAVTGAGGRLLEVLADVLAGLVPDHPALTRLGVRRLSLADVVDDLADLDRPPAWWRGLYAALAESAAPESLGALPVPLLGGRPTRVVRGPRGLLLLGAGLPTSLDATGLGALGLRIVHPEAAHPLLARLGATEATPRVVLEQPAVRAAVAHAWDGEPAGRGADIAAVQDAVLGLVAAADVRPGELAWLGELPLPDEEGEPAPACELVLPGSLLADVADPEAVGRPARDLVDRWGAGVLAAVGVLADLGVQVHEDLLLDPLEEGDPAPGFDDGAAWVRETVAAAADAAADDAATGAAVIAVEVAVIGDLDLVRDDAWDRVLAVVARDRALRAAVVEPVWLVLGDGTRVAAPSYPSWWLREHARLGGRPLTAFAVPGASDLAGLYDGLPRLDPAVDDGLLQAVGVRTSLAALLATPGGPADLLDRLADDRRDVPDASLARVYAGLAAVDPDAVPPPDRVRVGAGQVIGAEDALVLDAPHHLQLSWPQPPIVVGLHAAGALAVVLDVDTTSARLGAVAVRGGQQRGTPVPVRAVLPGAPDSWWEHDELVVVGQPVDWWLDDDGRVHAATMAGLARGLAWGAGDWSRRLLVAAVLEAPDRAADLVAEAQLDGARGP